MSLFDRPEMQVWDNAVFDNGEEEPPPFSKEVSWSPSFTKKLSDSLRSDDSFKENLNPMFLIDSCDGVESKEGGRNIDEEIEEVEREIERLSKKLKALRLEKAGQGNNGKMADKERTRGRIIPAKFMEQKVLRDDNTPAKAAGDKGKLNRRGVSLCPTEIYSTAMKSRPLANRLNVGSITPGLPLQSRRKSCFWKLDEIDELKVTKERRKSSTSMSLSPNAGKVAPKVQTQKQAATTIGSRKGGKKEESVISSIQPKRLFKDMEKERKKEKDRLVTTRGKVGKPGRVVASRYNQLTASAARKRSFPENEKEEAGRMDKRRNSNVAGKVKKRWEILPGDVVVYQSSEGEKDGGKDQGETELGKTNAAKTPSTIVKAGEGLRRIRVSRGMVGESPRDSGPAKRVAELEKRGRGRKYFGEEEEEGDEGFGKALAFIEDEEEEE
ncbi:hypothetical protein MLD38_009155 [Melastoma candidum]|uniref:Uncharacterized protein n=1 Tax=Melastoma candidum TaxID=119954 RepID=A0ACB9S0B7_9MYRT|nr:hypothetical protein MLD38_009155 [Melastoma candidum]